MTPVHLSFEMSASQQIVRYAALFAPIPEHLTLNLKGNTMMTISAAKRNIAQAEASLAEAKRQLEEATKPPTNPVTYLWPNGDQYLSGTTLVVKVRFTKTGQLYTYVLHKLGPFAWISSASGGHTPRSFTSRVEGWKDAYYVSCDLLEAVDSKSARR